MLFPVMIEVASSISGVGTLPSRLTRHDRRRSTDSVLSTRNSSISIATTGSDTTIPEEESHCYEQSSLLQLDNALNKASTFLKSPLHQLLCIGSKNMTAQSEPSHNGDSFGGEGPKTFISSADVEAGASKSADGGVDGQKTSAGTFPPAVACFWCMSMLGEMKYAGIS